MSVQLKQEYKIYFKHNLPRSKILERGVNESSSTSSSSSSDGFVPKDVAAVTMICTPFGSRLVTSTDRVCSVNQAPVTRKPKDDKSCETTSRFTGQNGVDGVPPEGGPVTVHKAFFSSNVAQPFAASANAFSFSSSALYTCNLSTLST